MGSGECSSEVRRIQSLRGCTRDSRHVLEVQISSDPNADQNEPVAVQGRQNLPQGRAIGDLRVSRQIAHKTICGGWRGWR